MKKILSLVLVLSMLLSVMAASIAVADKANDTLVVIPYTTSTNFDLFSMSQAADKTATHAIFDGLWQYGEDGTPIAALVESWEDSEDGRSIACKLREGVTFSDGTPVDADAIIWNYNTAIASDYLSTVVGPVISAIEKVDDYNIVIYKAAPYASVKELCCEYMLIVSPTAYEADPVAFQTNPVGSGPYTITKTDEVSGYLYLTAREDYWAGAPAIKNVEIRVPLDSSVALVALENNEAQLFAPIISADDLEIAESEGYPVYRDTGWSCKTVMFYGEPYTKDVNLCRAIFYAINRENAAIYNGDYNVEVSTAPYAKKLAGDYYGAVEYPGYDPEKAKEYLAQSDYSGETLEINATQDVVNICVSIQNDLQAIGISCTVNQIDTNTLTQKLMDGSIGIWVCDMGVAYASVEEMLGYFANGGFYVQLGLTVSTEAEDAALQAAANAWVKEERMPYIVTALEEFINNPSSLTLYETNMAFAASPELVGVKNIWAATYNYHLNELSWAE